MTMPLGDFWPEKNEYHINFFIAPTLDAKIDDTNLVKIIPKKSHKIDLSQIASKVCPMKKITRNSSFLRKIL